MYTWATPILTDVMRGTRPMEPQASEPSAAPAGKPVRRSRVSRMVHYLILLLCLYLALAYLALPILWRVYMYARPSLEAMPRITHTSSGVPGDPLNVALIGTETEVKASMSDAGWYLADKLGLRADLKIAADTVLKRPYDEAPVSRLFLFGRREDMAFEKPVGDNPRQRHHVRWWKVDELPNDGRPLWLGAVTFDRDVGFSHRTGQITHHISPDVDQERDGLFEDLAATGMLEKTYFEDNFHLQHEGRNGGGDRWHTDGRLQVGVLREFSHDSPAERSPPVSGGPVNDGSAK